jgi:hypothetical protein
VRNASLVEQILEQHTLIIFGFIVVRIHDREGFARQFLKVRHSEHERSGDGTGDAEFGRSGGGGGLSVERSGRGGHGGNGEEEYSERKIELALELELKRHEEAFRSPQEWTQRRGSVFEKHDFGGFDDGGNFVADFEFHFFGAAASDYAFDKVLPDTDDDVSHDATELEFFDGAFQGISSGECHKPKDTLGRCKIEDGKWKEEVRAR